MSSLFVTFFVFIFTFNGTIAYAQNDLQVYSSNDVVPQNHKVSLNKVLKKYLELPKKDREPLRYEMDEVFHSLGVPLRVLADEGKVKIFCDFALSKQIMVDATAVEIIDRAITARKPIRDVRQEVSLEQVNSAAFESYEAQISSDTHFVTGLIYPEGLYGEDGFTIVNSFNKVVTRVNQELAEVERILDVKLAPLAVHQYLEPIYYLTSKFQRVGYRILVRGQKPREVSYDFASVLGDDDDGTIVNSVLENIVTKKGLNTTLALKYLSNQKSEEGHLKIFEQVHQMNVSWKKKDSSGRRLKELHRVHLRAIGTKMFLITYHLNADQRVYPETREVQRIVSHLDSYGDGEVEYICVDGTKLVREFFKTGPSSLELSSAPEL